MGLIQFKMDDKVHKQAKSKAALKGQKLQDYLVEAVEEKNKRE